jgi:hypothetical protein
MIRKRDGYWQVRVYAGLDPLTRKPRYAYQRAPTKKLAEQAEARLITELADGRRQAAAALAARIVRQAGERARTLQPDDLDPGLLDHILDVAQVVCLGRANVPRHGYGKREIDGLPEVELPPRLAKQLTQLARCLAALGLDPERIRWLVTHAGLSSMPQLRLRSCRPWPVGKSCQSARSPAAPPPTATQPASPWRSCRPSASPTATTTTTTTASPPNSTGRWPGPTPP